MNRRRSPVGTAAFDRLRMVDKAWEVRYNFLVQANQISSVSVGVGPPGENRKPGENPGRDRRCKRVSFLPEAKAGHWGNLRRRRERERSESVPTREVRRPAWEECTRAPGIGAVWCSQKERGKRPRQFVIDCRGVLFPFPTVDPECIGGIPPGKEDVFMRRGRRRGLSLLLVLVMLLGLLPGTAWAAGDEITVYVSAAKDGAFLTGKDDQAIAGVPVKVSRDAATIDGVFSALHEEYYNGESQEGYATAESNWGASITKFWGIASSYVGYCYDHGYAKGLTDPVSEGGYLYFWFYQDTSSWSDQYVHFEAETATVAGGQAVELRLSGVDGVVGGAAITVDGQPLPGRATDEAGKITLYFPKAGEYLISAVPGSEEEYFVPPLCRVTVEGDDQNAAEAVAGDKQALALPDEATEDLTLPLVGASGKSTITWESNARDVIDNQGRVSRGAEMKTVTLTATLSYGSEEDTREFLVKVPALSQTELLERAAAALTGGLAPKQWNEEFTAPGDTNIVAVAQNAVDAVVKGVQVGATVVSDKESTIGMDGSITYGSRAQTVNVTFTLSIGGETRTVECAISVPRGAQTRQSVMDAITEEALQEAILKNNPSLDSVTDDMNFTSLSNVLGYCVKAEWSIPQEMSNYLDVRYGDVTRPAYGEQDQTLSLAVKLSWDMGMDPYMGYVGPVPEEKTFTYEVTIKAITEQEYNQAKSEVDAALAAYDPAVITYADDREVPVDLSAVAQTLNLQGISGLNCKWTTNDPDVIEAPAYKLGRAEVHRPAVGKPDIQCVLTLTAEKNGYSATREITVTVKAVEQAELDAQQAYMDAVERALSFDIIKKDNLRAEEVTGNLQMVYRGIYDSQTGKVTWKTSNTGNVGIVITWESSKPEVLKTYGTVTRPAQNTQVTLTAALHSTKLNDYIADKAVSIQLTVLADGQKNRVDALLENIASSYTDNSSEWVVMDMAAYLDSHKSTQYKTTDEAKQTYINTAINALSGVGIGEQTYSKTILAMQSIGVDPQRLYPVNSNSAISAIAGLNGISHSSSAWTAPYTLAAYNQGEYGSEVYEQTIIGQLLSNQSENGCWNEYGTIDTTANVIAGLSFYYDSDPQVKQAVDKALDYLSRQQKSTGVYDDGNTGEWAAGDNANSTAMVMIALASVGINPDTDSRFVKGETSLLDGLLSFALADNSGFGHTSSEQLNSGATEQAFRALIAASRVMADGKAYNIYDFSANTDLEPGRATGDGAVTPPVNPDPGNSNITVYFTMKADTGYWVSRKAVTVKEGSTVYHVFTTALEGTGITYTGAENGYISSVTKDGKTLGEFTSGKDSGWLYKVNGTLPDTGLTSYVVKNGDEVLWYYTTDWTTDPDAGSVTLRPDPNTVVKEQTDGSYQVSLPKGSTGSVLVTIPKVSKGDLLVIVHADGTQEVVKKSVIQNGTGYLMLDENATVKAVDYVSDFGDVKESAWYADAVDFTAGRGLFSGVGGGNFAPDETLSRGMVVTVLYALEEAGAQKTEGLFSDVAGDAWYAQGTAWAVKSGIVSGYGDGQFGPDDAITREQLALMLYRYAQYMKLSTGAGASLNAFGDKEAVSSWAQQAMSWAVSAGILGGTPEGNLNPGGTATRAEAAVMVSQFVTWMLGA